MKNQFFILFFLLSYGSHLFAQITITTTTVNATCSANGGINVTVNGGTAPYTFLLNGIPSGTVSANSYLINGLVPAPYQVQVTDANGVMSNVIADTITGNYTEPLLACVYSNCNVVANVSFGRAPFEYAMSVVGPNGPFGAYQNSNVFTNIPIVNTCYIRVKDSCANIYTASVAVNTTNINIFTNCTFVDSVTYNLTATASGGVAPYLYTCTTAANGTQTDSAGNFPNLLGCQYKIVVLDACGHKDSITSHSCLYPILSLDCINCTNGNVTISATGGIQPYTFTVNTGNNTFTNNSGVFAGLPTPNNGQYYMCKVNDACMGYLSYVDFYCLEAVISCGGGSSFNGQMDITLENGYLTHNPHFPITIICNSCATPDTQIINSALDLPVHFDGLLSGIQSFTMIDNCDNFYPLISDCEISYTGGMLYLPTGGGGGGNGTPIPGGDPGSGQTLGCGNTLVLTCQTPNVSYNLYYLSNGSLYASNATGIFPYIPANIYVLNIISPTGFILKIDTFDTSLYFTDFTKDCRLLMVGACPSGLVFALHDATGAPVVLGNTDGIFPNLIPGQWYQVFAKDTINNISISQWVQLDSIGDLEYDIIGCRNLQAFLTLPQNAQGDLVPVYALTGINTAFFQQNTTGLFPNLMNDTYTLTVTRGNCDTVIRQFTIGQPFNAIYCLELSSYLGNLVWNLKTNPPIGTLYGLIDINGNVIQHDALDSLKFKNLSVGTYTFTSPDCEMFTFTLPPFPDTTLNATISSLCTNLACIQATGGMTTLDWIYYENAFNVNVCYPTPDYYYLYYQNSFLSSNTTGLFCDLTLGGMYHIRLRRANVDIKIFDIFVPAYQQPNLTGLTGLVCNGVTSANVLLIVTGNGAPFTYNLLNPPTGYAPTQITTADTFATFPNLPIGSYQFMVYDGCGASSDFTANVTQLSFTASWQRYCDNTIQFFAPDYAGWQYTWTNSAGGVVGNTYNPWIQDIGAETYTISVVSAGCSYATTVTVPPYSGNPTPIDAGADIILSYSSPSTSTTLNGNVPTQNEPVEWLQVGTLPSVATIVNPLNASTLITITVPGIYTFVYNIHYADCSGWDTVQVNFSDCLFTTSWQRHCDSTIQLFASDNAGWQYTWTNSAGEVVGNTFNPWIQDIGAETYTISVVSAGCSYAITLTVPPYSGEHSPTDAGQDIVLLYPYLNPSVSTTLNGNIPAQNEPVEWLQMGNLPAVATMGNSLNPSTSISVTAPGVYTFIYTIHYADCWGWDTIQVTFVDCQTYLPIATTVEMSPENCEFTTHNGQISVLLQGGIGPYSYLWNTGDTTNSLNNLSTGIYTVQVIDAGGCFPYGGDSLNLSINVPYLSPQVEAYFESMPDNSKPLLLEEATFQFQNLSRNATAYLWTFGGIGTSTLTDPMLTIPDTGAWKVTLWAENEYCSDIYGLTYHIIPNGTIFIGNAFSPNGDNLNETFGPIGSHVVEMDFTIYDRWGKIVYQTQQMDKPWNGKKEEKPVQEGVYTFLLHAILENGKTVSQAGTVTLIR